MYIYCQFCGWNQDDYWTEEYNPLRSLLHWEERLLNVGDLDEPFPGEPGETRTWREVLREEIEHCGHRVRKMRFRTPEELRTKNPQAICPGCRKKPLAVD